MRKTKVGLALMVAAGLFAVLLPQADGIILTFGDSSFAFGTPLDDEGNQTVCSDGFEIIAASTPNDNGGPAIEIGLPTGQVDGSILASPVVGIYAASLIDDYELFELTSISTAEGFDLLNEDALLAAPRYGQMSVDIVLSDTFFALPPSDPPATKPAEGIGTGMFVPDVPLPIGADIIIVTGDYPTYGSHRPLRVVDCSVGSGDIEVIVKNRRVRPDLATRKISVHLINDGTFDIGTIADVQIAGATPILERMQDVDDDGDTDLRYKALVGDANVECGDESLSVTGTVDGVPFESIASIITRCPLPRAV